MSTLLERTDAFVLGLRIFIAIMTHRIAAGHFLIVHFKKNHST
jgi:hypothetical protein